MMTEKCITFLAMIIGSAPVNFFYFIFLLKTKESASLAWLFLHTGRWPACIESVFYWICGSRIFSLETLLLVFAIQSDEGRQLADKRTASRRRYRGQDSILIILEYQSIITVEKLQLWCTNSGCNTR